MKWEPPRRLKPKFGNSSTPTPCDSRCYISFEEGRLLLGVETSHIFGIFTPKLGEDEPNFDKHIFQWGW